LEFTRCAPVALARPRASSPSLRSSLASPITSAHVFAMSDFFAPWITDPDPPEEPMSPAASAAFAQAVAEAYPELIDHTHDGPIFRPARA
jgi:hypothetical protein